jgi:hypothetical protein
VHPTDSGLNLMMKTYTKDELELLKTALGDTARLKVAINSEGRKTTMKLYAASLITAVASAFMYYHNFERALKWVEIGCAFVIIGVLVDLLYRVVKRKQNVLLRLDLEPKISEIAQSISSNIIYRCGPLIITNQWIVNLAEFYSRKFIQVSECSSIRIDTVVTYNGISERGKRLMLVGVNKVGTDIKLFSVDKSDLASLTGALEQIFRKNEIIIDAALRDSVWLRKPSGTS